jgi:hypothetical protein
LEGLAIENLGMFYDLLVYFMYGHWKYFMAIWYIFWTFGVFLLVLVFGIKKNLATLPKRPVL